MSGFIVRCLVGSFTKVDGLPIDYYQIQTATLSGGLLARPAQTPPTHCGTNAFTCSFEVADFDATAEKIAWADRLQWKNSPFQGNLWQGYFLDADHNTFDLVQIDPNAE